MSLIDFMPTLLDLIDDAIPRNVDGISLKKTLIENKRTERDRVFVECTNGEIGVRTLDYLFSVLTKCDEDDESKREIVNDEFRFFDINSDPYQMNNLINDQSKREVLEDLKKSIFAFNEKTSWLQTNIMKLYEK